MISEKQMCDSDFGKIEVSSFSVQISNACSLPGTDWGYKNKASFLSLRPQHLQGWRDDKCDQQMAPFLVMAPSGLIGFLLHSFFSCK